MAVAVIRLVGIQMLPLVAIRQLLVLLLLVVVEAVVKTHSVHLAVLVLAVEEEQMAPANRPPGQELRVKVIMVRQVLNLVVAVEAAELVRLVAGLMAALA